MVRFQNSTASRALAASLVLLGVGTSSRAAVLAGWDFSSLGSNNFGPSPYTPAVVAAHMTSVGLTRNGSMVTGGSTNGVGWGAKGFDTLASSLSSAISKNQFAAFSLTPGSGFTASFANFSAYNTTRTSPGPTNGQWQYSLGTGSYSNIGSTIGWGSTSSAGVGQAAINLSSITDLQAVPAGTTVNFRVVFWGATGSAGTWQLHEFQTGNDFIVNGSADAVPIAELRDVPSATPFATATVGGTTPNFNLANVVPADGTKSGEVNVNIDGTANAVYILLDLKDNAGITSLGDALSLLPSISSVSTNRSAGTLGGYQFLHDYDIAFSFIPPSTDGSYDFKFDFTGVSGVTGIENIGVVPEPTHAVTVVTVGGLLLRYRRRQFILGWSMW